MNELEEIKNRIDIVELVGGYVELKKAGRNYKGLCPFHSEKTPSFMVSPEKQIWHCFGACAEGGDVFSFVEKVERLSFGEAVKKLADKAGVKLATGSYEKDETKKSLYSANELAADFYHEYLISDNGRGVRNYLIKKRKLNAKTIKEFTLGYSPNKKDALLTELAKHKITKIEAEKAGLAKKRDGEYRDFFYNRLMFPIKDTTGRPIAFSARVLDDSLPKYINTAETGVYVKSNVLYGMDLAKESIRKLDYVIITEGMMDVIASYQSGIKNVVAPGGTALTENQLRMIGRFTKNIKFAFDVDFAGSEATRRAIETALRIGFNIKVITLPEGKDPGDVAITKPEVWKKAIKEAKYVIDYLFDEALARNNKKDAMGRKYIARDLLPVIKRITDEIERDTYVKRLANELLVDESSILAALKNISLPKEQRVKIKEVEKVTDHQAELEKNTVGLLALFPNYLDFAESILTKDDFTEDATGKIYEKMLKYVSTKGDFSESKFLSSLNKGDAETFKHYVLSAEANYGDLDEEVKAEEIYFSVKRIKRISLAKKKKKLSELIEKCEKSKDKEGAGKALSDLNKVLTEEQKIS
ncbi:MAG: DNA primase [Patescibacteria group bacterium]|nr:DNA primase [Patescibacteria group bacterium]